VLRAQSDDELLVGFFFACLVEDTHVRLTTIESLGCFAQTTGKTVMDESEFEYTFQGIEDRHRSRRCTGISRDFDFIGSGDGGGGLFSVRHIGDVATLAVVKESIEISTILSEDPQRVTV
jgi:hypothetical protein